MGEHSTPSELKLEYDDDTGVLRDISQYVMTWNGLTVEELLQELSGFGTKAEFKIPVGRERVADIDLGGAFRTGANKPHALFHRAQPETPDSPSRTLRITWQAGAGGTFTEVETYVARYVRTPSKTEVTAFTVSLGVAAQRVEGTN